MKVSRALWGVWLLGAVLALSACKGDRMDIRPYYYPVEELKKEGKLYEYSTSRQQESQTSYWYFKALETDSGTHLINNYYDYAYVNRQFVLEEIGKNGVFAKEYLFMSINPDQQGHKVVTARIGDNVVFPFSVGKDSGVFPMEIQYEGPDDPREHTRLVRERQFIKDTIYTYQGEDLPAILFHSNEIMQFTHSVDGDYDHINYATEIYAKGIGLVSRKYMVGGIEVEMALKDIYTMEKFEKMASEYWGREMDLNPEGE